MFALPRRAPARPHARIDRMVARSNAGSSGPSTTLRLPELWNTRSRADRPGGGSTPRASSSLHAFSTARGRRR